jgi:hypothetical protein
MGIPCRSLKEAIDFFAFVTTGFCPVIARNSSAAVSSIFAFAIASPIPMLRTTFSMRGIAIGFWIPNSLAICGATSF